MKANITILLFAVMVTALLPLQVPQASESVTPAGDRSALLQEHGEEALGRVRWIRNIEEAGALAKSEDKPILFLFQDTPNSESVLEYGKTVLSHPLVVEAIESLFIPAVLSQRGINEKQAAFLQEEGFSGTGVRITDSEFREIAPEVGEDDSLHDLLGAMIEAYGFRGKDVPEYVKILYEETADPDTLETARFPVHCFWAGEVELGPSEGILQTVPGKVNNQETVEVVFDRSVTSYGKLLEEALHLGLSENDCSMNDEQHRTALELVGNGKVKTAGEMLPDRTPKYYLSKSAYRYVPMTERQSILVNSDLFFEREPAVHLSPRQIQMLEFIQSSGKRFWKNQIGAENLTESWVTLTNRIRKISNGEVTIH